MQRLRRFLSSDRGKPAPPDPDAVRVALIAKLRQRGCTVVEGADAERVVADAQAQSMVAALAHASLSTSSSSAEPAAALRRSVSADARCYVPQLNTYVLETSASAPDIEGTAEVMSTSWRHGKEIMAPEVRRSPSREHLTVTYRCVLTPKGRGDDADAADLMPAF